MESNFIDTSEAKSARVRLMALLALYDRLPPSIDGTVIPDFNPPPRFDSANDADSILRSLQAISQKLHIKGLDSFVASVFSTGHYANNAVTVRVFLPARLQLILHKTSCILPSVLRAPTRAAPCQQNPPL